MSELSKKQKLLKFLFQVLPHHAVSKITYLITRLPGPQVTPMINWFVKKYGVDIGEYLKRGLVLETSGQSVRG